jgi:hypothetical protein
VHHVGHGHAQRGGEVLRCHGLLFRRILEELDQAIGQSLGVARRVELNRQILILRHLAKVLEIGAHNRHTVGTCQMRHPAASRGGRIGHHGHAGALEKVR